MTGSPTQDEKPPAQTSDAAKEPSWEERLKRGWSKTRDTLNTPVGELFARKPEPLPSQPPPFDAPPLHQPTQPADLVPAKTPLPLTTPPVSSASHAPVTPSAPTSVPPPASASVTPTPPVAVVPPAPATTTPSTSASTLSASPDAVAPREPVASPGAVAPPVPRPAPAPPPPPLSTQAPKLEWKDRLKIGLARTRDTLNTPVSELFTRAKIDDELLEELETTLLMADCGVDATQWLLDELKATVKREKLDAPAKLRGALITKLDMLLKALEQPLVINAGHQPFIIMMVGVNGAGKTTSIGKLARHFQSQGKSVLLAAGDTFRAAAREQLMEWGARNNVTVIAQESGDPAAVVFDAIAAARARKIDVILADTAGRLPTQLHLMEEIAKVRRVIQKADPSGPHEVLLVLDANIGQNAIQQVKAFDKATGVTGLVVTKLDGTAKGGVLAAIARQCPKPVRFIGVGEGLEDLQPFKSREFVEALFGENTAP